MQGHVTKMRKGKRMRVHRTRAEESEDKQARKDKRKRKDIMESVCLDHGRQCGASRGGKGELLERKKDDGKATLLENHTRCRAEGVPWDNI